MKIRVNKATGEQSSKMVSGYNKYHIFSISRSGQCRSYASQRSAIYSNIRPGSNPANSQTVGKKSQNTEIYSVLDRLCG